MIRVIVALVLVAVTPAAGAGSASRITTPAPGPSAVAPTPSSWTTRQEAPPDTAGGGDVDDEVVATEPAAVPQDRAELDVEAEETLRALLGRLQGMERVRVEVDAGLAVLGGEVPSADVRERAEEVAALIDGVTFVDNRIELSSALTEQLGPAVDRLEGRLADLLALLPAFGVALLALLLAGVAARWVGGMDAPYALFTDNPFVENVLRQVVRAAIVFSGLLVAVEVLDITALVGAVVGTAGVAGLALGFAFKDIVENYLAGLLLSLRQPFAPSDQILIEGVGGKVVRLTSRETILLDLDGNHVRIPNATVFRSTVTNYTRNPLRRFEVPLTVAPGEDLSTAMGVGMEVLREMRGVLDDPAPAARVEEVGDSWVTLVWSGWVDQREADFLKVRSEATRLLLHRLDAEGVEMPPPEYRVRVVGAGDGAEGVLWTRPPTERERAAETGPAAPQHDVSVDRTLDEQIEEDRRASEEENLLG